MLAPPLKPFGSRNLLPGMDGLLHRRAMCGTQARECVNPMRHAGKIPMNRKEYEAGTRTTDAPSAYTPSQRFGAANFWAASSYELGRVEVGLTKSGIPSIWSNDRVKYPLCAMIYSSVGGVKGSNAGTPVRPIGWAEEFHSDGEPGNWATTTVMSWYSFRLREPIQIVSGNEYWVVLYAGSPTTDDSFNYRWHYDWATALATDHRRLSSPNGANWYVSANARFCIRTFSAGNPFMVYEDFKDAGAPTTFAPVGGVCVDWDDDSGADVWGDKAIRVMQSRANSYLELLLPRPVADWSMFIKHRAMAAPLENTTLLQVLDASDNQLFKCVNLTNHQRNCYHGSVVFGGGSSYWPYYWGVWVDFKSATGGLSNGSAGISSIQGPKQYPKRSEALGSTSAGNGQGSAAKIRIHPNTGNCKSAFKITKFIFSESEIFAETEL